VDVEFSLVSEELVALEKLAPGVDFPLVVLQIGPEGAFEAAEFALDAHPSRPDFLGRLLFLVSFHVQRPAILGREVSSALVALVSLVLVLDVLPPFRDDFVEVELVNPQIRVGAELGEAQTTLKGLGAGFGVFLRHVVTIENLKKKKD